MGTVHDPSDDPEAWTVAQLRMATSAERAMQPLDALLAFHEAARVAEQLEDDCPPGAHCPRAGKV